MTIFKTSKIRYEISEEEIKDLIFKHLKAYGEVAHFNKDNIKIHASTDSDDTLVEVYAIVEITAETK